MHIPVCSSQYSQNRFCCFQLLFYNRFNQSKMQRQPELMLFIAITCLVIYFFMEFDQFPKIHSNRQQYTTTQSLKCGKLIENDKLLENIQILELIFFMIDIIFCINVQSSIFYSHFHCHYQMSLLVIYMYFYYYCGCSYNCYCCGLLCYFLWIYLCFHMIFCFTMQC